MNRFNAILNAMAIDWSIVQVWKILELLIYGQIQPRIVDDIIAIIFFAILYILERREQERW